MHLINYPENPYFRSKKLNKCLYIVKQVDIINANSKLRYVIRRIILTPTKHIGDIIFYVIYDKSNKTHNYFKLMLTVGNVINLSNIAFKSFLKKVDGNLLTEPYINVNRCFRELYGDWLMYHDKHKIFFTDNGNTLMVDITLYKYRE